MQPMKKTNKFLIYARTKRFFARAFLMLAVISPGLAQADLDGFVFTETIDSGVRPFEIDNDFLSGGNIAVCTQGDNTGTQSIDVYTGTLGGSFNKTTIASGGQYFSSGCYTFNDNVYGTFIDNTAGRSVVFFRMDPAGTVITDSFAGTGYNAVDSGPVRVGGTDYVAAVGVMSSTLQSVVITSSLGLTGTQAMFTDSIVVKNPFAGGMVTKAASSGADEFLYTIAQEPDNDVVIKNWDLSSGSLTVTTNVINPGISSIGFPNEAGLVYGPAVNVSCYFVGGNPTISAVDPGLVVTHTTLPISGNPNYDIDCRSRSNGNYDVFVFDTHYEVDILTGQVINTHPITIDPGDAGYIPVSGTGGPFEGLFTSGSLVYGLGFDILATATPVPTLHDWMLILLALILLAVSGWAARRKFR